MVVSKQYIKDELKARGITQVKLARMLKVHPVSVHDVVSGKKSTRRIRAAVAMAIGKQVSDLWPAN